MGILSFAEFLALSFNGRTEDCRSSNEGSIPFGAANFILLKGL